MLLWVSDELTVDKAIENIGFGWFQAKLTVIIGLGWVCIILPRDALLARHMLSSGVCLCVRQAGVVSKRLAESSSFWHGGFLPLCYKEIRESPIFRAFPSGTLSQTSDLENFATASLSSCQWDNDIRRRRRSSLWTTPIRQLTSGGCLLQVGQL